MPEKIEATINAVGLAILLGFSVIILIKDVIMLFVICYEYSMSFTNVLKLFQVSKKYFWTFMEICSPMLKMGVRKAACIRKTVEKISGCFKNPGQLTDILTPREERIFETLNWFVEDSFSDGESCLHVSQLKQLPFVTGHLSNGMKVASSFEGIMNNLDNIKYVEVGQSKYYKTSRFLFFMEKYSGDTDWKQLNTLSVTEMIRRISEGEQKLREKEEEYFAKR